MMKTVSYCLHVDGELFIDKAFDLLLIGPPFDEAISGEDLPLGGGWHRSPHESRRRH